MKYDEILAGLQIVLQETQITIKDIDITASMLEGINQNHSHTSAEIDIRLRMIEAGLVLLVEFTNKAIAEHEQAYYQIKGDKL